MKKRILVATDRSRIPFEWRWWEGLWNWKFSRLVWEEYMLEVRGRGVIRSFLGGKT